MTRTRAMAVEVALLGVTLLLALLPLVRPELPSRAMLGPWASTLLWLPAGLWLAAALATATRPASAWWLRLLGRTSVWLLLLLVLLDPARNLPDVVKEGVGLALHRAADTLHATMAGAAGLLIGGVLLAVLLGGGTKTADTSDRRVVRSGSALNPVVAVLLRLLLRLAIRLAATLVVALLSAIAWTIEGRVGIAALRDGDMDHDRVMNALATSVSAVRSLAGGTTGLIGRASAGWGRHVEHGVWLSPASLSRDEAGAVSVRRWSAAGVVTPDDEELIELGAILEAMDVALGAHASRAQQPPQPGREAAAPRLHPYELRIARAWSRPGFHALVLTADPPAAGAAMAKVPVEQLALALDPLTRWTADELRTRIRLSDRRVAADELRGGVAGLFVGIDREPAEEASEDEADPIRAAVDRALRETPMGGRFRFAGVREADDGSTVLEYRASFTSAAAFGELEKAWLAAQPAVALYTRDTTTRLGVSLDPYGFLVTVPARPGQGWPSGEATDWARVVRDTGVSPRHPSRVAVGLDRRGEPVTVELAGSTAHALVGGASGSGKTTTLYGVLASLLHNDLSIAERASGAGWQPLELVIVEGIKRDVTSRFARAAVETVDAADRDVVVDAVERYLAVVQSRYRELDGRPYDPGRMGRRVLVLEEYGSLRLGLDRAADERMRRALVSIANTGRAVACSLVVSSQKLTATTLDPALKVNLALRLCGWYGQRTDYAVVLDVPSGFRLLPRIPGRMAMQTDEGTTTFQALRIDDRAIGRVVEAWADRFRGPPIRTANVLTEPDDPLPRRPTPDEVAALEPLTVASILYRWQAGSPEPITVSVRGVIGHVRELGHVPGRVEGWTAALAALEDKGILEPAGDHATAPRRLAVPDWPAARAILLGAPRA